MTQSYISWDITEEEIFDDEGVCVDAEEYALIEKIFVAPEDRRQGKARAMLRQTIEEIKAKHSGMKIKLAALPFGEDAIDMSDLVAFYESEGFSVENCDGHAVIMVL